MSSLIIPQKNDNDVYPVGLWKQLSHFMLWKFSKEFLEAGPAEKSKVSAFAEWLQTALYA